MSKKPLIVLTGPTAVGKTELSIQLAKKIGGEIISADSMQVYRYMDIGSAKIHCNEMQGIQHYLIDVLEPFEDFNVTIFQKMCKNALDEIYNKNKIPIITGGTGFYIQSILYDINFSSEDTNNDIRKGLEKKAVTEAGRKELFSYLEKVDPTSAERIHPNNIKRVIRAIEFYEDTGIRISEHNDCEKQKDSFYNSCYFVLTDDRSKLYQRIDQRVDVMIQKGLVNEVEKLKNMGLNRNLVSMQGLGYKEILDYLDGKISLEEAIYIIKRDTRHFAKRQLTWFRREKNVIWIDKTCFNSNDEVLTFMLKNMNSQGIF